MHSYGGASLSLRLAHGFSCYLRPPSAHQVERVTAAVAMPASPRWLHLPSPHCAWLRAWVVHGPALVELLLPGMRRKLGNLYHSIIALQTGPPAWCASCTGSGHHSHGTGSHRLASAAPRCRSCHRRKARQGSWYRSQALRRSWQLMAAAPHVDFSLCSLHQYQLCLSNTGNMTRCQVGCCSKRSEGVGEHDHVSPPPSVDQAQRWQLDKRIFIWG